MTPDRAEPDGSSEVVVRCVEDPGTVVTLREVRFPDPYGASFDVVVRARGLSARVEGEVYAWDGDLARFLEGLAADFRGWKGERVWDARYLAIRAAHHSRGRVSLAWTLRPVLSRDTWVVGVTTWLEAGAQLAALAADVGRFLRSPDPG